MAVELRYADRPGRVVELFGDVPSWKVAHRFDEIAPGDYRLELELPPGVYRYKLRIDGAAWVTGPSAASIDHLFGYANAELVVGGARRPLLFAPDRRHVGRLVHGADGGTIELRFEVEGPNALPAAIRLVDDRGTTIAEARPELVLERHGRRLARAALPLAPDRRPPITLVIDRAPPFEPDAPAEAREERFELPAHALVPRAAPAWLDGAVFYAIFVDRWHRAAPPTSDLAPPSAPSTEDTRYGGDLDGVTRGLDHLAALGVDAVILTPIFASPSIHRYDPVDLLTIDPALGGEPALRRLVDRAHALGLRVVVDVPLTHVNEAHPAFQSLLRDQARSPYATWFRVRRFPVVAGDGETVAHYYGHTELPWLALEHEAPRAHAIASVLHLAELGVDGVRLDAMDEAPAGFWSELRRTVRAEHPRFLFLGEVVIDHLAPFLDDLGADVVTDFTQRETLLDHFARGRLDAPSFWSRSEAERHRAGALPASARLLFLDNHDTARFRSLAFTHDRLRLALAYLLLARPEPIWLTYGTELGMAGGAHAEARDGVWSERQPMPPLEGLETETLFLLRRLLALRRAMPALRTGSVRLVEASGARLVVERSSGDQKVWIALNSGPTPRDLDVIPPSARSILDVNAALAAGPRMLGAFSARAFLVGDGPW